MLYLGGCQHLLYRQGSVVFCGTISQLGGFGRFTPDPGPGGLRGEGEVYIWPLTSCQCQTYEYQTRNFTHSHVKVGWYLIGEFNILLGLSLLAVYSFLKPPKCLLSVQTPEFTDYLIGCYQSLSRSFVWRA